MRFFGWSTVMKHLHDWRFIVSSYIVDASRGSSIVSMYNLDEFHGLEKLKTGNIKEITGHW